MPVKNSPDLGSLQRNEKFDCQGKSDKRGEILLVKNNLALTRKSEINRQGVSDDVDRVAEFP